MQAESHSIHHAHDHNQCVNEALEKAEQVCSERGLRLTALRKRVLELVWGSHKPVGAYDVLDALSSDGKKAAPPTVYRALEFLMEAGLVHRLDSLNAFIGCPDPRHPHSAQFLICRTCQSVIELDASNIDAAISAAANAEGFSAEEQMLEVQGVCRECLAER
ncbi:MAG: Fur family transcriptional regulator [Pseudomonadota bacterium]